MKTNKQYPKMVMIIRHGEKPGDPSNDKHGGPDLSVLGSARAVALTSLFTPDPQVSPTGDLQQLACNLSVGPKGEFTGTYGSSQLKAGQPRFPIPDFLFATKPDEGSKRPVETLTPLAKALGKSVPFSWKKYANSDYEALAKEILESAIYAGKVILICWHHGKIPDLVKAFKVPSGQLPWDKWPPTTFDLIFCITWINGRANLTVGNQKLLHGDTDCPPTFTAGTITPVLDAPLKAKISGESRLPQNFRSMNGPNMKDVKGKLASGSAQFSLMQLKTVISEGLIQLPVIVVDLRQESHGFLALKQPVHGEKEAAVSWFAERDWINVAKGLVSVQADEVGRLRGAAHSTDLTLYEITAKTPLEAGICTATAFPVTPAGTYNTEETLLQAHKIRYLRLPTTDRCRPRDAEVDRFITFETNLKPGIWLHFHCRAGDGRTTTFMAMHDIFHNAPPDSLDFILGRQEGLGGVNLREANKSKDSFEYPFEIERMEFLKSFYDYICQARPGGFKLTWSDWIIQNTTQIARRSRGKKS